MPVCQKLLSTARLTACIAKRQKSSSKSTVLCEEKDVAKDEEAREHMIRRSGQLGVPVIEIGDEIVIGFDRAKLSQLLGIK